MKTTYKIQVLKTSGTVSYSIFYNGRIMFSTRSYRSLVERIKELKAEDTRLGIRSNYAFPYCLKQRLEEDIYSYEY